MRYFSIAFSVVTGVHSSIVSELRYWQTMIWAGLVYAISVFFSVISHFAGTFFYFTLVTLDLLAIVSGVFASYYLYRFLKNTPTLADVSLEPLLPSSAVAESAGLDAEAQIQLSFLANMFLSLQKTCLEREVLMKKIRVAGVLVFFSCAFIWLTRLGVA